MRHFIVLVPLFLSACSGLGPECTKLRECCDSMPEFARAGCQQGLDEYGGEDGAEAYCKSAIGTLSLAGMCEASDAAQPTPRPRSTSASPTTRTSPEDNNASCQDGVDNDANGYVDCRDFNCSQNPNVTVCQPDTPVSTFEDNDASCRDGIDNDRDGFIDCDDYDCSRNAAVTVCGVSAPEDSNAACQDGIDNDRDGHLDCDDYDCSRNPNVTVC